MASNVRFAKYALVLVLLVLSPAFADSVSSVAFRVSASNASGSGYVQVPSSSLTYNPTLNRYSWSGAGLEVWGGDPNLDPNISVPIAVLGSVNLQFQFGNTKRITLGYNLDAGTSTTTFIIQTGEMFFNSLPATGPGQAQAKATATLGITEQTGDSATLRELLDPNPPYYGGAGSGMYHAMYNGLMPTGTHYADFVSLVQASGPYGSGSGYQNQTSYTALNAAVNEMNVRVGFTLTAGDAASLTSNYYMIPEPASCCLAALGALALLRLRR